MLLGVAITGSLIAEMEACSECCTSCKTMEEVDIKGGCASDRFAKRFGLVVVDHFLNIDINCVRPVIFHVGKVAVVRFLGSVHG